MAHQRRYESIAFFVLCRGVEKERTNESVGQEPTLEAGKTIKDSFVTRPMACSSMAHQRRYESIAFFVAKNVCEVRFP